MLRRTLLVAAVGGLAGTAARAESADVPIGAVEVLSGPNAAYGAAIRAGLELAAEEINGAGGVLGGRRIALRVEDSAGDKTGAINAARLLVGRDKVVAVLGPTLSNEMFAAGPVVNARHVPIIGTSTTADGITAIGPYVFRTCLPESDVIPVTMAYAKRRGVKSIALLYANDDAFSKSGHDVMKAASEAAGFKLLADESFGTRDTDFSAQLTTIKGKDPDAVGISALVEPVAGVLLQARHLGIPAGTLFIGGNGSNSPKLGEIAGAAADGLVVGSPWFIDKQDPKNEAFVAAFRKVHGHDPDQFAAQAFDAMHILADAVSRAGAPDPEKIRAALLTTDYDGVMGPFQFTKGRSPASAKGVVVLQMEGGRFRIAPGSATLSEP